jgi:dihydrofolate reductase
MAAPLSSSSPGLARLETSDGHGAGESGEDAAEFLKTIDCYVLGSRTYETALELGWPYGDTPVVVVTHRDLPATRLSIACYAGDLERLVNDRLRPRYKNIWLVGGAAVVRDFLRLDLADEIWVTIAPVIIGDGISFFDQIGKDIPLHLVDVQAYKSGFVSLRHEIRNE